MHDKNTNNEKGFTHFLVVWTLLVCTVIGLAGYRIHAELNDYTATTPIQETVEKKAARPQSNVHIAVPPATSVPSTAAAPKQTTPAPTTAPKPAPAFATSIVIKGSSICQSTTLDALKLLSTKAPAHYATVTTHISVIECALQGSGMFAYENPPRYLVGDATRNAGTVWYAGTIAHDAGHSKLYHDYASAHPGQSVPDNIWTGETAERACLEAQHDALSKIGGTQSQLDYVSSIINSQYYNIPYDQRWW